MRLWVARLLLVTLPLLSPTAHPLGELIRLRAGRQRPCRADSLQVGGSHSCDGTCLAPQIAAEGAPQEYSRATTETLQP